MTPAEIRKQKSEEFMKANNIPVYPKLNLMIDEGIARLRTADDIGRYLVILYILSLSDERKKLKKDECIQFLKMHGMYEDLNVMWKKYLEGNHPCLVGDFYAEAIIPISIVLLWAVNKIDVLPMPILKYTKKNFEMLDKILSNSINNFDAFITSLSIRPVSEILNEADKYGRIFVSFLNSKPDSTERKKLEGFMPWYTIHNYDIAFCWLLFSDRAKDITCTLIHYTLEYRFEDRSQYEKIVKTKNVKKINDKKIQFKFVHSSKKLSKSDFVYVEGTIGQKLPKDIKTLYALYNGGHIAGGRRIYINEADEKGMFEAGVNEFYPMKYKRNKEDALFEEEYIFWYKEKKLIKEHFIPFADDGSGNPYCFNIKDNKIYMLDHEDPEEMRYVAPSLIVFINGMVTEKQAGF